jgi:hypothetical protein
MERRNQGQGKFPLKFGLLSTTQAAAARDPVPAVPRLRVSAFPGRPAMATTTLLPNSFPSFHKMLTIVVSLSLYLFLNFISRCSLVLSPRLANVACPCPPARRRSTGWRAS